MVAGEITKQVYVKRNQVKKPIKKPIKKPVKKPVKKSRKLCPNKRNPQLP